MIDALLLSNSTIDWRDIATPLVNASGAVHNFVNTRVQDDNDLSKVLIYISGGFKKIVRIDLNVDIV